MVLEASGDCAGSTDDYGSVDDSRGNSESGVAPASGDRAGDSDYVVCERWFRARKIAVGSVRTMAVCVAVAET